MVVTPVRIFAHVPVADASAVVKPTFALAANGNAVVKAAATLAADRDAIVETTAALEATAVAMQATMATMEVTSAAMEATASAVEATVAAIEATAAAAIEATASVKAAATASGIGRAGQNHRATQHSRTCGDFPHEVHGCRNSTPSHVRSMTFVRHVQQMVNSNATNNFAPRQLCLSRLAPLWLGPTVFAVSTAAFKIRE